MVNVMSDSGSRLMAAGSKEVHTPTPWIVSRNDSLEIVASNGWIVCRVTHDRHTKDDADFCGGNAALIVRAVNSHAELVNAAREALGALTADTIGTVNMDDPDWYARVNAAVEKLNAALAKANAR